MEADIGIRSLIRETFAEERNMSGSHCPENPPRTPATMMVAILGRKSRVRGRDRRPEGSVGVVSLRISFDKGGSHADDFFYWCIEHVKKINLLFAAKVVVELGKSDQYIQAGVMLHLARVTVDDIKDVRDPIAVMGAEHDWVSPPELLKQFKEVLSNKPEVRLME